MSRIKRVIPILVVLLLVSLLWGCARKQYPGRTPEAPNSGGSTSPAVESTDPLPEATDGPTPSGLPDAGALPQPTAPPQVYVVQAGDTLSAIARRFGTDLNELVKANNINNPNALQVGQQLRIPSTEVETSPAIHLLPNSEFVNGPAYVDFDIATFAMRHGGYLNSYQENVGGELLSGPEIVDLVVHHYSVGPRMLLAILELESGWVTNPSPTGQALYQALGPRGGGQGSLHTQLAWAADKLNEGYYNWRGRGMPLKLWGDGTAIQYTPTLNAATAGLQYFFSLNSSKSEWQVLVGDGPGSFLQTYRRLFGDPGQYAIEPLIPADTTSPALILPWSAGELWFYTGGPHGGWNDGSAWAAIDVVPDEGFLGCQVASSWAISAAEGLVIYSRDGEVMVDVDEDGHQETGWVLFYLHVSNQDRVPVDTRVRQGDRIGHPSCEGGFSESTHLHLARLYNGEWIAADGPLPLILSGWQFYSAGTQYEGSASRAGEERTACECRDGAVNGLVADR